MFSTEEDKSFYTEFPAATVIVLLLFSHPTRLHYAVDAAQTRSCPYQDDYPYSNVKSIKE